MRTLATIEVGGDVRLSIVRRVASALGVSTGEYVAGMDAVRYLPRAKRMLAARVVWSANARKRRRAS